MSILPDNLDKYECLACGEQFIVSEFVAKKVRNIHCPYCVSQNTEAVSCIREDLLEELGCFGIYHKK